MHTEYRDILLRDMTPQDIADEIRWNTTQTEWGDWDAPWETEETFRTYDMAAHRQRLEAFLQRPKPEIRRSLEIEVNGVHIGTVSAYAMDAGCCPAKDGPYLALGLDICESQLWGQGLGKRALTAWILYFLGHGQGELYLQTWSGNVRMIRAAERLGFREFRRKPRLRQVRGAVYDALTFRLDLALFHRYLLEENLRSLALTESTVQATLACYDCRPGYHQRHSALAYAGQVPNFPINRLPPLERLVVWGCRLTQVRQRYQDMGIPYPVVENTLADIALRARLYTAKTGKPGLSKADGIWFRHLDNQCIFRLGSLQFQRFSMVYLDKGGSGEDWMTFDPAVKEQLPPGQPVINVHVQRGADLSPQAVADSLHQAEKFFATHFPECRWFLCYSWLLYPGMEALLPAGSNILAFSRGFQIIGQANDPADAIGQIYGRRYPRKADYPQDTALQRAALGKFSRLGWGCGIRPVGRPSPLPAKACR